VPGVPELPDVDTGLEVAEEMAAPVLPVLVALDWPPATPELPEVAVGAAVTEAAPPAPPPDWLVATLAPPVAVGLVTAPDAGATTLAAGPPVPELAVAVPPLPPVPPLAVVLSRLVAPPAGPDWALASEAAPALALLEDRPELDDCPESPLGGTVMAGACPGVDDGMVAGTELEGVEVGVWATAAPPQNTRMAATTAPTVAKRLEIVLVPSLPAFMLIPCRWVGVDHVG
jgi:hypothetical protein